MVHFPIFGANPCRLNVGFDLCPGDSNVIEKKKLKFMTKYSFVCHSKVITERQINV
jgi:hypothetical protein